MQVGCHPMFIEENFDAAPRAPWVKKLSALYCLNQLAEEYVYSLLEHWEERRREERMRAWRRQGEKRGGESRRLTGEDSFCESDTALRLLLCLSPQ